MTVKSQALKTNTNGVTLDTDGDNFSILLSDNAMSVVTNKLSSENASDVASKIHEEQDPTSQVIFGTGGGGGGGVQPDHITSLVWENSQYFLPFDNDRSFLFLDLPVDGQPADGLIDVLRFDATYSITDGNTSSLPGNFSLEINGVTTDLTEGVDYIASGAGVWVELYLADHTLIGYSDQIKLIGSYGGTTVETALLSTSTTEFVPYFFM